MQEEKKINKNQSIYKKELERLFVKYGGELTPLIVVENAKDKRSPLHDYFTWEDSDAAKLWRLHQARVLFGYVKIDLSHIKKGKKVRIAIQVTNKKKESVYVPIGTAIKTRSYAKQLIDEIVSEISTLQDKLLIFKHSLK